MLEKNNIKKSQSNIAEICEVSEGTVSKWNTSKTPPSWEHLYKLHERFGVSFDYLLGIDDNTGVTYNSELPEILKSIFIYKFRNGLYSDDMSVHKKVEEVDIGHPEIPEIRHDTVEIKSGYVSFCSRFDDDVYYEIFDQFERLYGVDLNLEMKITAICAYIDKRFPILPFKV